MKGLLINQQLPPSDMSCKILNTRESGRQIHTDGRDTVEYDDLLTKGLHKQCRLRALSKHHKHFPRTCLVLVQAGLVLVLELPRSGPMETRCVVKLYELAPIHLWAPSQMCQGECPSIRALMPFFLRGYTYHPALFP